EYAARRRPRAVAPRCAGERARPSGSDAWPWSSIAGPGLLPVLGSGVHAPSIASPRHRATSPFRGWGDPHRDRPAPYTGVVNTPPDAGRIEVPPDPRDLPGTFPHRL